MLRAAGWTVGLFGVGMLVCRLFPWRWIEPAVLIALGFTFLAVSARMGGPRPRRAPKLAPKQAAA